MEPLHEVDQLFRSQDEWLAWAGAHPGVYDGTAGSRLAQLIVADGFVEPLTANGLNSRMRAVLALVQEKTGGIAPHDARILAAEAVTPFALVLRGLFARCLCSEYAATEDGKRSLFPIPVLDLTDLALPPDCFDLVVSNEVLEHVPDLDRALSEMARVLKPGGWHVGTHPFAFTERDSIVRSALVDGTVVHLMEPERHGNPVDPEGGSLVFEIPAWDIVERGRRAGFADVHMRFMASRRSGIATENTGVFCLCARK